MLNRPDLLALRLRALLLAGNQADGPAAVVRHFLALQAQDFPALLWAVGQRAGVDLAAVEQACKDGQIVRSWPLRGTLHVTLAEDVAWLRRLLAAKALGVSAQRRRERLGLTLQDIETVRAGVVEALAGGRALSREALLAELSSRGIVVESNLLYHLIWFLSQTGLLLFGPVVDGEPLIVLTDEWVKSSRVLDREEGLAELAARYVCSHGPASVDDLAWWAGLGKREAAQALALAADRAVRVVSDDGVAYWMSPALAASEAPAGLALLPAFDEHLLGYRDRTLMLDPDHASAVCPGGNGIFKPVVAVDGKCVGTWRSLARGALKRWPVDKPVPLTVTWFDRTVSRRADPQLLAAAADRYARYLGRGQAEVIIAAG
ncbi:MAG: winged helix DNA-binding domain-containing protein [Propionibacteriaceae bacterium]|jgi:hypothetical protein|nr:winged helix DNA-binding domain-containing protein [Propionibacteriaceae bacterium]